MAMFQIVNIVCEEHFYTVQQAMFRNHDTTQTQKGMFYLVVYFLQPKSSVF